MSQPGSRFYNCRFEGNKSTETSLGYGNAAGAIGLDENDLSNSFFQDKFLIIDGCEFVRNEGRTEAGAINARHNTKIYNSLFYQNSGAMVQRSCIHHGNKELVKEQIYKLITHYSELLLSLKIDAHC